MANGPGIRKRLKNVPEFFETATPEQARAFVRHFAGRVEAIKVYDRLPREAYLALVDEARRLGLEVVGHRPLAVSAIEAAQHQKSIEHARFILQESFPGSAALREVAGTPQWREDRRRMLDEHDPAMAEAIFAAMKANGTWYVPTHLTRWVDAYADDARVRQDPLLRYLHPLMHWQWLEDVDATVKQDPSPAGRETYREFYRKGLELTGAAHRAGVKILVGTDYIVAGVDVHRELEQLVLAGLTPADALFAATVAPADYFGRVRSIWKRGAGQDRRSPLARGQSAGRHSQHAANSRRHFQRQLLRPGEIGSDRRSRAAPGAELVGRLQDFVAVHQEPGGVLTARGTAALFCGRCLSDPVTAGVSDRSNIARIAKLLRQGGVGLGE